MVLGAIRHKVVNVMSRANISRTQVRQIYFGFWQVETNPEHFVFGVAILSFLLVSYWIVAVILCIMIGVNTVIL